MELGGPPAPAASWGTHFQALWRLRRGSPVTVRCGAWGSCWGRALWVSGGDSEWSDWLAWGLRPRCGGGRCVSGLRMVVGSGHLMSEGHELWGASGCTEAEGSPVPPAAFHRAASQSAACQDGVNTCQLLPPRDAPLATRSQVAVCLATCRPRATTSCPEPALSRAGHPGDTPKCLPAGGEASSCLRGAVAGGKLVPVWGRWGTEAREEAPDSRHFAAVQAPWFKCCLNSF